MNRRLANVVASGGWEGGKTGGSAESTTKSGHTEAKAEYTSETERSKYPINHTQNTAKYTIKRGSLLPTPAPDPVRLHSAQRSLRWLQPLCGLGDCLPVTAFVPGWALSTIGPKHYSLPHSRALLLPQCYLRRPKHGRVASGYY